jgi:hypothetical protein
MSPLLLRRSKIWSSLPEMAFFFAEALSGVALADRTRVGDERIDRRRSTNRGREMDADLQVGSMN